MSIWLLVVGLILFVGLVVVHEWGHFVAAVRNGVEAEEYSIFFGPPLFRRKTKHGWVFSIRTLPLGGYVKLKGEHDTDTEPGSFGAASLWVKSKIMAAGVVMNLVVAVVLFMIVAWLGMPQLVPNQFTVKSDTHTVKSEILAANVEPNSPAAHAGLRQDDRVLAIGPIGHTQRVVSAESLQELTQKYAGQEVQVLYARQGVERTATTKLISQKEVDASMASYKKELQNAKTDCASITPPKGHLGVVPQAYTLQRSTWSAPVVAVGLTGQLTGLTFDGLGRALSGLGSTIAGALTGNSTARHNGQCAASSQVAGPVGVYAIMKDGSLLGYQFMLMIVAVISLTLAIMNILPIPALDGGRLWLTLIMRGIKRPLTPKREEAINVAGFLILITLMVLITVIDVKRFF